MSEDDLNTIVDRQPQENVLPERIKNVGFIYSSDRAILVNLLNIMDEICLSSPDKPMFIKRSFVLDFTADINANYLVQKVAETNSIAIIAAGVFPQEKIYEMGTVFNSAGILFKNITADTNKSEIIDFMLELVIR